MDNGTAYTGPSNFSVDETAVLTAVKDKRMVITMTTLCIDRIIGLLQNCDVIKAEKDYPYITRAMLTDNELARFHKSLQDFYIDIYGTSGASQILDKALLDDPKTRRAALVIVTEGLYEELRKMTAALRRIVSN